MKTASWSGYRGAGRVGISIGHPRWLPDVPRYPPLMPRRSMLRLHYDRYLELYTEQLAKLDPERVVADLTALAAGHEPVLLCYERPPFAPDNWCHRRMVADWLEKRLGLLVPELPAIK